MSSAIQLKKRIYNIFSNSYTAYAVNSDGSTSRLSKTTGITGASDNAKGCISVWLKVSPSATDASDTDIFTMTTNNTMLLRRTATTGKIRMYFKNPAGTVICDASTTTGILKTNNTWHHIYACWDFTAAVGYIEIWIDRAKETLSFATAQALGNTVAFGTLSSAFGVLCDQVGNQKLAGDVAEIFFCVGKITPINRFIDRNSKPKLVSHISGNLVYLKGPASTIATNYASGGNMTNVVAMADSTTSPST